MRSLAGLIALLLCSTPVGAVGQPQPDTSAQSTLGQLRGAQSRLLDQLETNQSVRDSVALRGSELATVIQQIIAARVDYNAEVERVNALCRDPYEVAPQETRETRCAIWQAGLRRRSNEIESATADVKQQVSGLHGEDESRVREAEQLHRELMSSVQKSVELCRRLSPRSRASVCAAPPSAGAKTVELVASFQAMFDSIENPCADLISIRGRIDCERQGWDGSTSDPGTGPVPRAEGV